MESVRATLIENFPSIQPAGHKCKITTLSKPLIEKVMAGSGLTWFRKNGRPVIHWKHQNEQKQ